MLFWKAVSMLYSFDVLHFEEKAEKLVKIVAEKAAFYLMRSVK
jgi:hypothetical protein